MDYRLIKTKKNLIKLRSKKSVKERLKAVQLSWGFMVGVLLLIPAVLLTAFNVPPENGETDSDGIFSMLLAGFALLLVSQAYFSMTRQVQENKRFAKKPKKKTMKRYVELAIFAEQSECKTAQGYIEQVRSELERTGRKLTEGELREIIEFIERETPKNCKETELAEERLDEMFSAAISTKKAA